MSKHQNKIFLKDVGLFLCLIPYIALHWSSTLRCSIQFKIFVLINLVVTFIYVIFFGVRTSSFNKCKLAVFSVSSQSSGFVFTHLIILIISWLNYCLWKYNIHLNLIIVFRKKINIVIVAKEFCFCLFCNKLLVWLKPKKPLLWE